MLGRQQVFLELEEGECEDTEDLTDIMSNVHLNNNFLALGREVSGREGGGGREGGREEGVRLLMVFEISDPPLPLFLPPSSSSTLQLDIMEPKLPEDIYKTHLEHAREQHLVLW